MSEGLEETISSSTRWKIRWRARRGRAVDRAEHAAYAIEYAEGELESERLQTEQTIGAVALGVAAGLVVLAIVLELVTLVALAGPPVGLATAYMRAPGNLRRSIEKNRELLR